MSGRRRTDEPLVGAYLAADAGRVMSRWPVQGTQIAYYERPAPGRLIAHQHAVWRVIETTDIHPANWTEEERQAEATRSRFSRFDPPYAVVVEPYAGGKRQHWRAPANFRGFWLYPESGRWPQCSCCGEPMPCQAELEDRAATAALATMERHASKLPGCCWACGEPITARQEAVVYAGMNLDAPGGPEVRFHTRRRCWSSAVRYEDRWRADDRSRPRILTYPSCPAMLIVHGDGSSECFGGADGCHGHLTHDHSHISACVYRSHGCGRGCTQDGHPGARPNPRPRRTQEALS